MKPGAQNVTLVTGKALYPFRNWSKFPEKWLKGVFLLGIKIANSQKGGEK